MVWFGNKVMNYGKEGGEKNKSKFKIQGKGGMSFTDKRGL